MNILFVCSANRFRSVIAAGYFDHLLRTKKSTSTLMVDSAGTWVMEGLPPIPEAVQYARSRGFSVDQVRSKEVDHALIESSRLVIVMSAGQKESIALEFPEFTAKLFLLADICKEMVYDIPDLGENEEETAFELADEICALLDVGFDRICSKVNLD